MTNPEPSITADGSPPLLELRHIRKTYGGVVAISDANLRVSQAGSVHALAGENGSGKSTLLGILSGQVAPDQGEIRINGRPVTFSSPAEAIAHGICMVSQETSIALDLTAAENIMLGRMVRRWWGVDRKASAREAQSHLTRLGSNINPHSVARDLRPDQLQMVEIARALSMNAKVLILDEPTSSLAADEAAALLRVVDELRREDVVTIFVSHRMSEVFSIADEISVLRDGTVAYCGPASTQNADTLVALMLGAAKAGRAKELAETRDAAPGAVVLDVRDLSREDCFEDVTLTVHAGEIVGLAGLEGSGKSELLESLFGETPPERGAVTVKGRSFTPSNPRHAIDAGIAYLPPDRKTRGLVLTMSIRGNASMVGTLTRSRAAAPNKRLESELVDRLVNQTTLRMGNPDDPVGTLSGGNQQKIALGKWLVDGKDILLLDEPTRGVDIGAKQEIHTLLRTVADNGGAILVSSSENEELLAVCDRIIVMARRQVVGELPAATATLDQITTLSREGGHEPVN